VIAIPAIDLRGGACVQLVGGSFDDERIRIPDVLDVARGWARAGFQRLHVVDLDAASEAGANAGTIDALLHLPVVATSVGGGVRTTERIEQLIDAGADRVIVGTRALEDRDWLETIAAKFAGRVVVAADVRRRRIVTRAWARELSLDIVDVIAALNALPLGGILVTAVHCEGRMQGPDVALIEDVVRTTHHAVTAAGGIATMDDLRTLQSSGASACVIGMALYSGGLDPRAVAAEFNA
jgi:phosphoribosylformimino-5-aminoimidazole carboxamide ribotide isomerase